MEASLVTSTMGDTPWKVLETALQGGREILGVLV